MKKKETLINISNKTFIRVTALLAALVVVSVILTFIIPAGQFGENADGTVNYSEYTQRSDIKGINIIKGIFSPVLVFFSDNGITLIMLSLFLLVISAAFQVMNDVGGIKALIGSVSEKFKERRLLLVAVISFFFMCFGAFLGLFEEMLTMLPIVAALCIMIGYDSFSGFLISIVACGFGFASAITNPFTVLLASQIIGVNPVHHIYYRFIIFAVMYAMLFGFTVLYIRKTEKDPTSSFTYEHDLRLKNNAELNEDNVNIFNTKRTSFVYIIFLVLSLVLILTCSLIPSLRDYTVVVLTAYFLIFGIIAGVLASSDIKSVLKSFLRGLVGALPTLVFIGLASAVKYVFDEGSIMPTIVWQINRMTAGKSVIAVALVIYLIILVLEFSYRRRLRKRSL